METTAQCYLWLYHRAVVKDIPIVSLSYMYTQRYAHGTAHNNFDVRLLKIGGYAIWPHAKDDLGNGI